MYFRFLLAFLFSLTSGLVVAQDATPPADPLMPPGVQEAPPVPTPPPPPPGKTLKTPPTPPVGKKAKGPPTPPGGKPAPKKKNKKKK